MLASEKPIQQVINKEIMKSGETKERMDSFKRVAHAKVNAKDLKNCAMGNLKPSDQKTQQALYSAEYLLVASDDALKQRAIVTRSGEKVEASVGQLMSSKAKALGEDTLHRVANSFHTFTDVMATRAASIEMNMDREKTMVKSQEKEKSQAIDLDWEM